MRALCFLVAMGMGMVLVGVSTEGAAQMLQVGDRLPAIALEDQHGVEQEVGAAVRVVLFTRDMEAGDTVEAALADVDAAYLEARGTLVMSDIHRMPGFVTRLFALPKLRRRPYPMLLDRQGDATQRLPFEEGQVTWLGLDALKIVAIRHVSSAEVLRSELDALEAGAGAEGGGEE